MSYTILQATKTMHSNVNTNENLYFDNILINEGDIIYDNSTGKIIINEIGHYMFNWSVCSQALPTTAGPIFSLVVSNSLSQINLLDNSSIKQNEIIGFGVFTVDAIPTEVSLENTSLGTAYVSDNIPIKANILITKIPNISPLPYIDLSIIGNQTLGNNDFINFSSVELNNIITYDSTMNLIAITEPGIYQIILNLFTDATTIKMNSISYPGDKDFNLPSGYGFTTINFLYRLENPNYIGFSNPSGTNINIGIPGSNPNGGLTITKVSNL